MAQYKLIRKNRQLQPADPCHCYQNDHVDLVVEGAGIRLCRLSSLSVPAEVSAYIPRVEIRQRRYENGQLTCEDERIYNSITVVHAPRHPLENPPSPLAPLSPAPALTPIAEANGDVGNNGNNQPPTPGEQPPAPEVPTAPGPDQPGAAEPPVIPSEPEPHPPPVSPRANPPFPAAPMRKAQSRNEPVITINKRRL